MIREFARKHMKTQEIKIDEEVAHLIWSKGVRSPPRKIRVKLTKTDDGYILVTNYEDDVEPTEKDSKKSKKDAAQYCSPIILSPSEATYGFAVR